jgi:hypothetical protein
MNKIPERASGNISVSDIALKHLSRGLYRSNATAFKELINNAFDADATIARIDTNYPVFDFISCYDDGDGMTLEEFRRYFKAEGIGTCIKRKGKKDKDTTKIYNRPIIGKLGIGMMAIGQICHSFEIESHYFDKGEKKGKAFHATIILEDISIPREDEIVYDPNIEERDIDIGTWAYDIIEFDERRKGFRIYSSDVRKTFRDEMRKSLDKKTQNKISFKLSDLQSRFYRKASKSIRKCGAYLETIWELSILCPIPYHDDMQKYPINIGLLNNTSNHEAEKAINFIKARQKQLVSYNFNVFFDGIRLYREISFPTAVDVIPKLYFIKYNSVVFDSLLQFQGYIFAQASKAIRPFELDGIQIRLRNVGIGGYDHTFYKYSEEIETIRSRWVSGEIFVDKGLESALNIDRDSFNEHDEHFKKLQMKLHEKLHSVFKEINKLSREKSDAKSDKKETELRRYISKTILDQTDGKLSLRQARLGKSKPIVKIDDKKGNVILNIDAKPLKKKKANQIIGAMMIAYQTAREIYKNEKEREKYFFEIARKILGELV